MRLNVLLSLAVAALPWSLAGADVVAYDAPVLPPPSFVQRAATTGSVVELAGSAAAYDAPVLPPPSLLRFVVRSKPSVESVVVPTTWEPAPAEAPAPATAHFSNTDSEEMSAEPPKVRVYESPCLSAACAPCQGFPSCGDRANCPRFWFASAEATFLGIRADTGGQALIGFDNSAFPGVELESTAGDGLDGFSVAPRLTLGYQFGPLWAVAGRFWSLSEAVEESPDVTPAVANLDDFFVNEQVRTELDAMDLEAIRSFTPGLWKLDAAAGVRHAAIGTSTQMEAFADFDGNVSINSSLASDTRFDGTGPTVALTGRRRIGATPAFLVVGGRSSMLWGSADARARVDSILTTPADGFPGSAEVVRPADNPMLWIGEVHLGVQWELRLTAIPATAFLRTAVEYQYWEVDGVGGGSPVELPPPPPPAPGTYTVFSSIGAGDSRVELYGLAVAAGFTW